MLKSLCDSVKKPFFPFIHVFHHVGKAQNKGTEAEEKRKAAEIYVSADKGTKGHVYDPKNQ